MFGSRSPRIRRARLVPIALTTAALSSAVLGASVTGTLSAFQASITNTTNTATAGSLVMQETDQTGKVSCFSSSGNNNNSATCPGINKYGGTDTPFIPGRTVDTPVYIANIGVSDVRTFTITPAACKSTKSEATREASSADLCDSLQLTLTCVPVDGDGKPTDDVVTVYDAKTLTQIAKPDAEVDLGLKSPSCVPKASGGNGVKFVFSVHMPKEQDNTVQGQSVTQPITWAFTGA